MMFVMEKYQEEAWTPELGGMFEDLQLKIRYVTPDEGKQILADNAAQVEVDGKPEFRVDLVKAMLSATKITLSRVTGWKNTGTKFSDENKRKLLALLLEDRTGITLEGKDEPAKLGDYIGWFATNRENFLAASAST